MPQQSHGSASWPAVNLQHRNESQAIDSRPMDQHGNVICFSRGRSSGTSDEDEPSWREAVDEHQCEVGKQACPWQRIKWTDAMIKLLIDIVSLIGEDGSADSLDMNKRTLGQKKGKWRTISNIMNEKGWSASPQQCEDKFNDLNKRYKRLTDILGRDVALQVVDNIHLLDSITDLSAKKKEDVRKILASKHSFYKEMHSYHSGIKSGMPAAELRFVKASEVKGGKIGTGNSIPVADNLQGANTENGEGSTSEEPHTDNVSDQVAADRGTSYVCQIERTLKTSTCNHSSLSSDECRPQSGSSDLPTAVQGKNYTAQELPVLQHQLMYLEEMKVKLQAKALDYERQYHKWERINSMKDSELERLREENKRMKLENSKLEFQLRQKELEVECKHSATSATLLDVVLERLRTKEDLTSIQGHVG
ncbi:hypothetical protein KP509_23G062900 [Ceratopteris richardii]|nr:hypothetical protein KP509_23G062900 [Ceratopteris richardii]